MLFLIYDPWKDPNGSRPARHPAAGRRRAAAAGRRPAGCTPGSSSPSSPPSSSGPCFTVHDVGLPAAGRRRQRRGRPPGRAAGVGACSCRRCSSAARWPASAGWSSSPAPSSSCGRASASYGYIAFLASWLARHQPVKVAAAAVLLAAIAIGGDSLQIDSGLPAAAVNVLMALVLLAVFGRHRRSRSATREERADDMRPRRLEVRRPAASAAARRSSTPRSARRSPSGPGVVNLGTEGSMLVGALAALRGHRRDRQPVGRRARRRRRRRRCSPSSTPYFVLHRGANQLATGLVVLFLGLGLTSLFGAAYVRRVASTPSRRSPIPGLSEHPVARRRSSSTRTRSIYLSFVRRCRPCWWLLYRSRWGLLLRAAGERERGARRLRPLAAAGPVPRRRRSAACWPASAAPSCRSPTPTPGSRT